MTVLIKNTEFQQVLGASEGACGFRNWDGCSKVSGWGENSLHAAWLSTNPSSGFFRKACKAEIDQYLFHSHSTISFGTLHSLASIQDNRLSGFVWRQFYYSPKPIILRRDEEVRRQTVQTTWQNPLSSSPFNVPCLSTQPFFLWAPGTLFYKTETGSILKTKHSLHIFKVLKIWNRNV